MFVQAGLDDERRFNERGVTRPLASPFVKLAGYRVGDARVDNGVQASEFRAVREDESSKLDAVHARSEERRVGKEGRSRWSPYHLKKKKRKKTGAAAVRCRARIAGHRQQRRKM